MMTASAAQPEIRVMLVDDSAVVRGLISRALQAYDNIQIVASASDGEMAISALKRNPADIILLDVEMPVKSGLQALPELKSIAPKAHIIMVSSLTQRNAEISLEALSLGATDYVAKPSSHGSHDELDGFYRQLSQKILALGASIVQNPDAVAPVPAIKQPASASTPSPSRSAHSMPAKAASASVSLAHFKPRAIGIASSTGGPQALIGLFSNLSADILRNVPVFITQHMPPTFTTLLAEQITNDTKITCREAVDGETVSPGVIYIAPGDYHMRIVGDSAKQTIALNQSPPVNFCRPAADPMLESLVACYRNGLLCLVLTGMGNDGAAGAQQVKDAGGVVLAQDKESSVVWGMPGAVAAKNAQDALMPVAEMANSIQQMLRGAP